MTKLSVPPPQTAGSRQKKSWTKKQLGANAEQEHSVHLHRPKKTAMKSAAIHLFDESQVVHTQVDAPVDGSEEFGAAEREHVGFQQRLAGGVVGSVHDPGSAVRALQRHRSDYEERNGDDM